MEAKPMGRLEAAGGGKSIATVILDSFTAKTLFSPDVLRACEAAVDEVMEYRVEVGPKRQVDLEEETEVDKPLVKKICKMPVGPNVGHKQAKGCRKRDRRAEEKWRMYGHLPRQSVIQKYIGSSQEWKTPYQVSNSSAKAGGYSAKSRSLKDLGDIRSLQEAKALGFAVIECNGSDRPILDSQGRVLAVLISPPDDPSYQESTRRAFEAMEMQAANANFQEKDLNHKRGRNFAAINIGLSYGNGHTRPTQPKLGRFCSLADALLGDADIQRLASYQDATYALWHPRGYRYYKENLDKLWEEHPELTQPLFPKSIMPTVAFNLGSQVATKRHVDSQNCPFGWCLVTALGDFDSAKGGHLILWDLGLILEFPAGACICLPSAIVTHSNIPIEGHEKRMSFTQYCSGEIFRYIENGFRTDSALKRDDPAIYLFRANARTKRLQEGYSMFSTIADLVKKGNTGKAAQGAR